MTSGRLPPNLLHDAAPPSPESFASKTPELVPTTSASSKRAVHVFNRPKICGADRRQVGRDVNPCCTRIRGLEDLIIVDGENGCPVSRIIRHTTDGAAAPRQGGGKSASRSCLSQDVRARSSVNQIGVGDGALKAAIHHHPATVEIRCR